jgi:hypothetical protein
MRRTVLSRRTLLRGAVGGGALVTVPIPRLSMMLNGNGTAYAQGQPLRRTFGVWFFGNGVIPNRWIPAREGLDFPLSDQLAPLAKVKTKLTVVSSMQLKTGRMSAHSYGATGGLGGAPMASGGNVSAPTIDQIIADLIAGDTRRSIEIGVTRARHRTKGQMYDAVSHRGTNQPNYPEFNPAAVFATIFPGGGAPPAPTGPAPNPMTDKLPMVRKSVLDAVRLDAADLQKRVGREDRARLDAHLEGLRGVERRLFPPAAAPRGAACRPGKELVAGVLPDTKDEAPPEVNKVMADMIVLALSCDVTRVFSFMFSYPAAHVHFRSIGLTEDFHNTLCHAEAEPQAKVHKGVLYMMTCFAYLLEEMDKIQEGEGTLLDNSAVLISSCVAYGRTHQREDWPVLIAGRAGGALKGNLHVKAPMDNPTKVLLTLANIYGARKTELGKGPCLANQELGAIRA